MGRLPFETGYLSTMSEVELGELARELQYSNFWQEEEAIQSMVDQYMQFHRGSQTLNGFTMPYRTIAPIIDPPAEMFTNNGILPTYSVQTIEMKVPHYLDDRTARLFAEIQVREQLQETYDPTEADT